ncbi:MAG: hypothetical protein FWG66_00045 [Spirochaetes bacterium]|nr:hypothetical protein [Spirochaetota bacterium]
MKRLTGFFLLLVLTLASLYAQEQAEQLEAGQLPNLIIHSGDLFHTRSFQFLDGTPIPARELNNVLNIPENEQILIDLRRLTIGRRVNTALSLAGFAGTVVYLSAGWENWPGYEVATSLFIGLWLGPWIANLFLRNAEQTRVMMAVDNFNLSILGLPVAGPQR